MKLKALITGITGQDGSYLAEFLLNKDYEVHGIVRRVASEDREQRLWRIRHLLADLRLHAASLESYASLCKVFQAVEPQECYHLAAQSYVGYSFEDEFSTFEVNINGTQHLLAALRQCAPGCRFYFAGSSEMFGKAESVPQNELTPFHPQSTYAISKVAGYNLTRHYREAYGIHASCGMLFNHESPRRGHEFVTRKITSHVAKIKFGLVKELPLGDLDAQRDWGHARDYVAAMWLMVQQPKGDEYVIGTGKSYSVRDFLELAFGHVGFDYHQYVKFDPQFMRPAEPERFLADASKAKSILGWESGITFKDLVVEMVEADLEICRQARHGMQATRREKGKEPPSQVQYPSLERP